MIADYAFSHRSDDIAMLRSISKIAASALSPFIAAANPTLFGMNSWAELASSQDLCEIFGSPDYEAWASLRDAKEARYLGLCLPRVLARPPYGAKTKPIEEFDFEELTDGHAGRNYAWMNAAYAMAVNINCAYREYGWCTRISGVHAGGDVINLPAHLFQADDCGRDRICSAEIGLGHSCGLDFTRLGFIPIIHTDKSDTEAFVGAQSIYRPKSCDTAEAAISDYLSARLPYIFAVSRFAHYLKSIVREQSGSMLKDHELTTLLQSWVDQYVDDNLAHAKEPAAKASMPLAAAKVQVIENAGNPGTYYATFQIKPHYQLVGSWAEISDSLIDPWLRVP